MVPKEWKNLSFVESYNGQELNKCCVDKNTKKSNNSSKNLIYMAISISFQTFFVQIVVDS